MQKVIVLGANGFIGSNLTTYLAEKGIIVIALVDARFDYSRIKDLRNVECIEFSLEDLDDYFAMRRFTGSDVIYHLAWEGVNAQYRNDPDIQARNILHGIKVFKFANSCGVKKVIIPGSAAEVACGSEPITGREVAAPTDMYSAAKVATRYVCQEYARQLGISLIWTLITSIYGPGRDDNNLLSYAIKSMLKGEKPSFTRLEQQWDYLYIDDLMEALYALGEKGIGGKVYPIGSGEHRQMREYVEIIRRLINPEAELGIGDLPYKTAKIDNQIMNITELKKDTGFSRRYTFEQGILKVIDFFKDINS